MGLSSATKGVDITPLLAPQEEELELSPVQAQIWNEYDDAVRERRDRLARRQFWPRLDMWLRRQAREGDVRFYIWALALVGTGALVLRFLMHLFGVSF